MNDSTRRTPWRAGAIAGAAVAALVVAGCSSTSSSGSGSGGSSAAAGGSSSGASGGMTTITTASASGATFLIDGSGRALYLWTQDKNGKSACSGACASQWPPLTGTVTSSGSVKASDLGTITRSDGTKQVTYDGHPLYYYVGDSGAGNANGQGSTQFGGHWWLVSPSGSTVTASVTSFTAGGSGSSSSPAGGSTGGGGGGWG